MFFGLNHIVKLDLRNFDLRNVEDIENFLACCYMLEEVETGVNFNFPKAKSMWWFASYDEKLRKLDLSRLNNSKLSNMYIAFWGCSNLSMTMTLRSNFSTYDGPYGEFEYIFNNAATVSGSKIVLNYTSKTEAIVDRIIAKKNVNSNIVKGNKVS